MTVPIRRALTTYEHPYDVVFTPRWGWNVGITILQDHRVFRLLPQFATWTKADHVRESGYMLRTAVTLEAAYIACSTDALDTYGREGRLISGIVRDHFPIEVKDLLRSLAIRQSRAERISLAHWSAAGKQLSTWRTERDRQQKERAK